jgi:hypothetical protein
MTNLPKTGIIPRPIRRYLGSWPSKLRCCFLQSSGERLEQHREEFAGFRGHPSEALDVASPYTVAAGIVRGFGDEHLPIVAACVELGVRYRVVDITRAAWLARLGSFRPDLWLAVSSPFNSAIKAMYDERLSALELLTGMRLYPDARALQIYENKVRMHYWFAGNNIPHTKTWVLHDEVSALEFFNGAEYPLIFKPVIGSGSTNIRILRGVREGRRIARECFRKGFWYWQKGRYERQQGVCLVQEFLPDIKEWRLLRIGDSWFGHQKGKRGDFHSGSDIVVWEPPPERLLNFAETVCQKGDFRAMNLDVFETPDGNYLVNEMQAIWGAYRPFQMLVQGRPGRFLRRGQAWLFDEGIFCQNRCWTLRVADALGQLGQEVELPRPAWRPGDMV